MNHQLKSLQQCHLKSFVKDVVKCLEQVTPKSNIADAADTSWSNTVTINTLEISLTRHLIQTHKKLQVQIS